MTKAVTDLCWSTNNENFYQDFSMATDDLEVGDTYYEADVKNHVPSDFFGRWALDRMLEKISESAADVCGEHSGDFPDVQPDVKAALLADIQAALDRHLKCDFYTAENVREKTLTQEDVEGVPAQGGAA